MEPDPPSTAKEAIERSLASTGHATARATEIYSKKSKKTGLNRPVKVGKNWKIRKGGPLNPGN
ncbi:hypothetical protein TorRG33x02_271320 [Trema orientale]|uniref:Uncharacterized protein n=1 Tax=Trema orientale TaxID=63057 RepID=A0A2P5CW33_TREOI|nr:hypothetical protein TorRG33x02_271320 [Trema orientale]